MTFSAAVSHDRATDKLLSIASINAKSATVMNHHKEQAAHHRNIFQKVDHLVLRLVWGQGPEIVKQQGGHRGEHQQCCCSPARLPAEYQ